MKLLIVTTQKDMSCNRIIEEAKKKKIEVTKILYEDLNLQNLNLKKFNFCILRDPYNTGEDFSNHLKKIASFFKPNQLLDYETYKEYPFYEDKLFQHHFFKNHLIMPKIQHYNDINEINVKFPIIIKKRISSRGKGTFIMNNKEELKQFFNKNSITDYLFEENLEIEKDIRVILINNKVIGTVERRVRFKKNGDYNNIGVKVLGKYKPNKEIKEKAILTSKLIKSDFCGVDFIIDKNNKNYLIECNISPQFSSSEHILNINIAKKLIEFMLKKAG